MIGGYILLNAGSNLASSLGLGGGGGGGGPLGGIGTGSGSGSGPGTGPNPNPGSAPPNSFPYAPATGGILGSPGQTIGNIGIGVGILGAGYGFARYIAPPLAQRIGSALGGAATGGAEVGVEGISYDATLASLAAGGDIAAGGVGLIPANLIAPQPGQTFHFPNISGKTTTYTVPGGANKNSIPSLLNPTTQRQIASVITHTPATQFRSHTRRTLTFPF